MGERPPGLTPPDGKPGDSRRIEKEISTLRREMGDLVDELDRRRREVFDVRLQARRHPVAASLAGVAAAVVIGGALAILIRNGNGRRERRARYKAQQLRVAMARMIEHPERVAVGESPRDKILAAVGSAAAALLVRRVLERAVPRPAREHARPAGGPFP